MALYVDLLLKDELLYELQWRGFPVTINNTVATLRKQLRKALKENIPTDWNNLTILRVSIEIDNCREKIDELKAIIKGLGEITEDVHVHRLRERVSHLKRRLENLSVNAESRLSEESRKRVMEWIDETEKWGGLLEKRLSGLDATVAQESLRKLSESHEAEESKVEVDIDLMTDDVFEPASKLGPPGISRESIPEKSGVVADNQGAVNDNKGSVHLTNSDMGDNRASNVNSAGKYSNQTIGVSELFTKLVNPLERVLKEIPTNTNGLDHLKLLSLINVVIKIKRYGKLSDVQVLEVVSSYVSEPLLGKINFHIQSGSSLRVTHNALLCYFIPRGMYEKLKRDMVHRPQRMDEPLAMYVCEIKNNVELLMCDYSEAELVDLIIMGINPNDRSKLVFQGLPKTFQDLERLCVFMQNIDYNDKERDESRGVRHQPRGGFLGKGCINNVSEQAGVDQNNPNNNRLCYYCSRPGHLIRDCWKRNRGARGGFSRGGFSRGGLSGGPSWESTSPPDNQYAENQNQGN